MKTWRVTRDVSVTYELKVEADDKAGALAKADNTLAFDWKAVRGSTSVDFEYAEEVTQ